MRATATMVVGGEDALHAVAVVDPELTRRILQPRILDGNPHPHPHDRMDPQSVLPTARLCVTCVRRFCT